MHFDFFNLKINPQLICNFLAIFSRIEYSLKATKYVDGGEKKVSPNWDKFANAIDKNFSEIENKDNELKEAVNYLKNHPPKKQILENGKLIFIDQKIDTKQKQTQQILFMVRTVRNNLFHGGKYHKNIKDRDELLIKYSLKILSECVKLDEDVYRFYISY